MRIVHEIYGRAQVSGTVTQYHPPKGKSPSGGSCDLILAVTAGPALVTEHGDSVVLDGEAIHIDGDVDDVIDMLQSALDLLRIATGDDFVFKRAHEGFTHQREKV